MLLVAAGCGGGPGLATVAPVTGIVRYNGVPVRDAYVKFSQEGCPIVAGGFTDDMGRFELTSYQKGDGAPVGENKVTITVTPLPSADTDDLQSLQADAETTEDPAERRAKMAEVISRQKKAHMAAGSAEARSRIPKKYSSEATSKLSFPVVARTENVCEFDLTD